MFFSLWLGIIGPPFPAEVIVMTGGAVSNANSMHPIITFLSAYLGVISGLTFGYVLGSRIGAPILNKLRARKSLSKYIAISDRLVEKHGLSVLLFFYFLPVVRHVVPYLMGINRISFWRYAAISFSTGFMWTLLFFSLGRFITKDSMSLCTLIFEYECYILLTVIAAISGGLVIRSKMKSKVVMQDS
nr:DedA family protein [Paenibacillus paeoniae]